MTGFEIQQVSLAPQPAAVAGEFAVCPNDSVTRNDDGYSIISIRSRHCPDRIGKTYRFGLFFVRTG
jgi:hypothetical protein